MSVDPPHSNVDPDDELLRRAKDEMEATQHLPPASPARITEVFRDPPARLPRKVGRYHVKRVIATGGMGTVYEAVQEHPRRSVAVKVMKHGVTSRLAMRRFEYESQILARLRHPGIAQVYEAGTHDDGHGPVPYFAMEYIPNAKPITRYAEEKKLGKRDRLELFAKVCDALHHGHQKGIIHRDLKPSNILVDSHGHARVIDFGVARSTDSDMAVTTLQTDIGQLVGTLQYMSPEQCEADPHDLDTRSDVYALGVVLYELLCRTLPYDVSKIPLYGGTRLVREQQPPRLSMIDRGLRGDVETIVLKALEKERERRYQSALELGQDIRRYLSNESILARAPSLTYQIRILARRYKTAVAAAIAILGVLIAGLIVSTGMYYRAEEARAREAKERGRAVAAEQSAEEHQIEAEHQRDAADEAKLRVEVRERAARRTLYTAQIMLAQQAWDQGDVGSMRELLGSQRPGPEEEDLRGFEWYYLRRLCTSDEPTLKPHPGYVLAVAFSPDGKTLASTSYQAVKLWDVATREERAHFDGHMSFVDCAAFSPDGRTLATGSQDQTLRLWDVATGEPRAVFKPGAVRAVAFSPDGALLAAVGRTGIKDAMATLIDLRTGEEHLALEGHESPVYSVTFSVDGKTLITGDGSGDVRFWNVDTGELTATVPALAGEVLSVACSPLGSTLATGGWDAEAVGVVKLWDMESRRLRRTLVRGHAGEVSAVAFSPDGATLVSGSGDRTVTLWDTATGREITTFRGHTDWVKSVAFSSDGRLVASGSMDKTVKLWNVNLRQEHLTLPGRSIALSPDSRVLATVTDAQQIRLWDVQTGDQKALLTGHRFPVMSMAFSPDGASLASAARHTAWVWKDNNWVIDRSRSVSELKLWAVHSQRELISVTDMPWIHAVAFSPDGVTLAIAGGRSSETHEVALWDTRTLDERVILKPPSNDAFHAVTLAFSPDGNLLAAGARDGVVALWQLGSAQAWLLKGHGATVTSVAFSRDGEMLATTSVDGTVKLWDVETRTGRAMLPGHTPTAWSVAFSPDGLRVATGGEDGTVKLWDPVSGKVRATLRAHSDPVRYLAFTSDGRLLVSGGATLIPGDEDGTVKLWRAAARDAD